MLASKNHIMNGKHEEDLEYREASLLQWINESDYWRRWLSTAEQVWQESRLMTLVDDGWYRVFQWHYVPLFKVFCLPFFWEDCAGCSWSLHSKLDCTSHLCVESLTIITWNGLLRQEISGTNHDNNHPIIHIKNSLWFSLRKINISRILTIAVDRIFGVLIITTRERDREREREREREWDR